MRKKVKQSIWWTGLILFLIYMLLLVYFLFFSEEFGRAVETDKRFRYNLQPFLEIRRFWKYRETLGMVSFINNVLGNIIGFFPYGMILPIIIPRMRQGFLVVLSGFWLSLGVEALQLFTGVGCFDVDDLLLNTFGTLSGYLVFFAMNQIRRKHYG